MIIFNESDERLASIDNTSLMIKRGNYFGAARINCEYQMAKKCDVIELVHNIIIKMCFVISGGAVWRARYRIHHVSMRS